MKNLIPIFALFLLLSIGCNKADEVPATSTPQLTEESNPTIIVNDGEVEYRGVDVDACCCQMVISSTYFGGMSICGVDTQFANGVCGGFTTTCGNTGTLAQTLTKPGTFCAIPTRPFCITNTGLQQFQFYFICPQNSFIPPTWIQPNTTLCYSWDCNGTITNC